MGEQYIGDIQSDTITGEKVKTPSQYRVVMHNDDYTTMEFVVEALVVIFKKPNTEAVSLMEKIHTSGQATVGVYAYDIAISRVKQVHEAAKQFDFPLKCTVVEDGAE